MYFFNLGCYQLTDEGIMSIVGGCPVLENFNVEGCTKMTDQSTKFIAEYSTELKVSYFGIYFTNIRLILLP